MKTLAFIMLMVLGFFAVITAMARPDIIEKQYWKIREPYDRYKDEQKKTAWETAYNQERAQWMLKNALPSECNAPRTAVEEVQCNELSRERERKFAQVWKINVRKGWKPDGMEN